jgi:glucose-1-phosphate thymidylyltransferase
VTAIAKMVQASDRGELEITSVQTAYLDQDRLRVELIGRGIAWLDTGTPESLLEASQFIHAIEKRQNMKVACLEEVALEMGFISLSDFEHTINGLPNSLYKEYCKKILSER